MFTQIIFQSLGNKFLHSYIGFPDQLLSKGNTLYVILIPVSRIAASLSGAVIALVLSKDTLLLIWSAVLSGAK